MALIINDKMSINTLTHHSYNQSPFANALEKLYYNQKINSSTDDHSDYQINAKIRAAIRDLYQENYNIQIEKSMLKVAASTVNNTAEILRTLKEKNYQRC